MNLLTLRRPRSLAFEWHEIRVACLFVIAIALAFALGLQVAARWMPELQQHEFFGGDFPTFYRAGLVLQSHPPAALYDDALNTQLHLALRPADGALRLPYVYPPFVAYLFIPFSHFSYPTALLLWLIVSGALAALAVRLLMRHDSFDTRTRTIGTFLALSFEPLIYETWLGGQLSVFALVSIALAVHCEDKDRRFLSGLALSLCIYKPTLLVLIAPMLLLTRRWQTLAGLATGAAAILGASLAAIGPEPFSNFLHAAQLHSQRALANPGFFKLVKFVDLNLFSTVAAGSYSLWLRLAFAPLVIYVLWRLASYWWTCPPRNRIASWSSWALAIAWTLLLNIYVPVYDTAILIVACALAARVVADSDDGQVAESFAFFLTLLYLAPWVSQALADALHIQFLTLVLLAFGFYLLALVRCNEKSPDAIRARALM